MADFNTNTPKIDIVEELYASDEASALTNKAGRYIEKLHVEIERLENIVMTEKAVDID